MASTRRKLCKKAVIVDIGCGCVKPSLSDIFCPKRRSGKANLVQKYDNTCASSSSSWDQSRFSINDDESSTTTFDVSSRYAETESSAKTVKSTGKIGESVVFEKDSSDPYLDFRNSMLQMILEREIYSNDDLRELLDCFLSLNSPSHHETIVKAFTEIWNGVFARPSRVSRVRSRSGSHARALRKSRFYNQDSG